MKFYSLSEAAEALRQKGATEPCPRCGRTRFSVLGEGSVDVLPPSTGILRSAVKNWSQIPTLLVVCDNCGYLAQHAQATLSGQGATALQGR